MESGGDGGESSSKYCRLSDVRISLDGVARFVQEEVEGGDEEEENRGFSLCFWIYLSNSALPCSVLLNQTNPTAEGDIPFVALNEESKLIIFPILGLHEDAPGPGSSFPWKGVTHLSAYNAYPLNRWVHIGCQVTKKYMHLHINGMMVARTNLRFVPGSGSLSSGKTQKDSLKLTTIVGNKGKVEGYFYNSQVFPSPVSIKSQYIKDQPVRLFLDNSSFPDGVEAGPDGVWNIVGGKPSCRRNFTLEVLLLNGIGQPVCRDMEIMASLVYADNGAPVEKSRDDGEEPLLLSCDGVEYPSTNRPVPLVRGRAVFKLKIAQLTSKCDNRLFRVFFSPFIPQKKYPFLETYSQPIRCISRSKQNQRTIGSGRKISPTSHKTSNGHTNGTACSLIREVNNNNKEIRNQNQSFLNQHQNGSVDKFDQLEKRPEVECEMPVVQKDTDGSSLVELDAMTNDAELSNSDCKDANEVIEPKLGRCGAISDSMVFKYCLESIYERSIILRETLSTASDDDITDFAKRVVLYTGCSHHRNQILMAKKLIEEGNETWDIISSDKTRVLWTCAIQEIVKKFMCISHSKNRSLSGQDIEVLRGIADCNEEMERDHFFRLWNWMYPVGLTLARDRINKLWECLIPNKWIEGFVTKEEAENALKRGLNGPNKEPGKFLLRFPTTRSWPHPDAGNLVISYVGSDLEIRHKLLALDYSDERGELQHLLLEEPELTQPARFIRPEVYC